MDSTIRLYDPEHAIVISDDTRRSKRRNRFFAVGECPQLVRDYMREHGADSPSTNDVVDALAIVQGVNYATLNDDKQKAFYKSVMRALKRGVVSGWLAEHYLDHGVIHWRLSHQ